MPVTVSDIEVDIQGLKNQQIEKRTNNRTLRKGIKDLKAEQAELRLLIKKKNSGYNPAAMKANVQMIKKQIIEIEATILKEQAGIDQLKMMIGVLQDRIKRMTGDL